MDLLEGAIKIYMALVESPVVVDYAAMWSWPTVRQALQATPAGVSLVPQIEALSENVRSRLLKSVAEFAPFGSMGEVYTFPNEANAHTFMGVCEGADSIRYLGGEEFAVEVVTEDLHIARELATENSGKPYSHSVLAEDYSRVDTSLPSEMLNVANTPAVRELLLSHLAPSRSLSEATQFDLAPLEIFKARLLNFCDKKDQVLGVDQTLARAICEAKLLPEKELAALKKLISEDNNPVADTSGSSSGGNDQQEGGVASDQPSDDGKSAAASKSGEDKAAEKPTEMQPGEEGLRLPDGTVVPEDVLKQALAKLLMNLANQLENGTEDKQGDATSSSETPPSSEKPAAPADTAPAPAPTEAPTKEPASESALPIVVKVNDIILVEGATIDFAGNAKVGPVTIQGRWKVKNIPAVAERTDKNIVFSRGSQCFGLREAKLSKLFEATKPIVTYTSGATSEALLAAARLVESNKYTDIASGAKIIKGFALGADMPLREALLSRLVPLCESKTLRSGAAQIVQEAISALGKVDITEAMSGAAKDWISSKVSMLIDDEGMSREQAVAVAYAMARKRGFDVPKKAKSEGQECEPYHMSEAKDKNDLGNTSEINVAREAVEAAKALVLDIKTDMFKLVTSELVRLEAVLKALNMNKYSKAAGKLRSGFDKLHDEVKDSLAKFEKFCDKFHEEDKVADVPAMATAPAPPPAPPADAAPMAADTAPATPPMAESLQEPVIPARISETAKRVNATYIGDMVRSGLYYKQIAEAIRCECGDLVLTEREIRQVYQVLVDAK